MIARAFFLALPFLPLNAFAQEAVTCKLEVPGTLSANSEVRAQATCSCPITAFEAKVFNRWGHDILSTSKLEGFPNDLLALKELQSGTYFWQVKYTATLDGVPVELEASGYLTVIK